MIQLKDELRIEKIQGKYMKKLLLLLTVLVGCGQSMPAAEIIDDQNSYNQMGYSSPSEISPDKTSKGIWDVANVCDTFERRVTKDNKSRYRRIRVPWTKEDRKRTKQLAKTIAQEMGADPRYLLLAMARGSGYNPHAIHILNPDIEAHVNAYKKFRWSEKKEKRLAEIVSAGPQSYSDKRYYKAKRDLRRVQTYKDNPYYEQRVTYDVVMPNGDRYKESMPVFNYGTGPLDMNSVYFVKHWDKNSPPWIFCSHQGIPAFITMIWALRKSQKECISLEKQGKLPEGTGNTWGVIDRRYAVGRCKEPSQKFVNRAKKRGLDPNGKARLGKKWPRETTNRQEILEHMINKAKEQGLID